jgi:hypothetical protein
MKKSPEPIILAVALGVLALTAGLLAFFFPAWTDITGVPTTTPQGHSPPRMKEEDLKSGLAPWTSPINWGIPDDNHRLFISDGFLFYPSQYPDGNYLAKFDETARTPSGVLISWYQKYGLDFTDPNVDREDPDGDGFSNIVEFKNEVLKAADADGSKSTSPLDPNSHPTFLSRLRMQNYDSRPFHIQFRGHEVIDGVQYFQIALKDVPSEQQPRLKKVGDPLGVEDYIVGPYHESIVTETDEKTGLVSPVDESTLELDKPAIDFKIILTYRKETDSPESTANFVMLMPGQENNVIKVPRGKTFSPPFMSGTTFLVIDANKDGAIVEKAGTKDKITVPLLDPKEWDEVPVAPAAAAPAK